ncbi:hypothetical protein XBI1_1570132 [Xenorhabdus bovienii str. Intermedium]|uniref:Uncharacterized protein n=1 Tax=Xenorhabdus bovienii str. Intermedium TaxID=1379677 RepID=A0A077QEZ3_XENBV|nr:hypothetical protein XBI1_1570132 [Xenorhabdus bovienii str. Intermedium]
MSFSLAVGHDLFAIVGGGVDIGKIVAEHTCQAFVLVKERLVDEKNSVYR